MLLQARTGHADSRIVQADLATSQPGVHNALYCFLIACSGIAAKVINQQASNSGT